MKNWANPWRMSFPSSMKISTSFCKNFLQTFLRSSGMVALNIITCLLWGVLINIYWIFALIPGFPITLSHSSTTKNLTFSKLIILFLARSKRRPGVAIIIWGFLVGSLNSLIFYSRATPPKYAAHLKSGFLKYLPSLLKSLNIWWASYRVWHVTIHWCGS